MKTMYTHYWRQRTGLVRDPFNKLDTGLGEDEENGNGNGNGNGHGGGGGGGGLRGSVLGLSEMRIR
jgi:hypothetical protein